MAHSVFGLPLKVQHLPMALEFFEDLSVVDGSLQGGACCHPSAESPCVSRGDTMLVEANLCPTRVSCVESR